MQQTINTAGYNGELIIYSLPNGMQADSSLVQMYAETSPDTIRYGNLQDHVIADMSIMYWTDVEGAHLLDASVATECTLYFCVHTYQASVVRGQFKETLLHSFPNTSTTKAETQTAIKPASSTASLPPAHPTSVVYVDIGAGIATLTAPHDNDTYTIDIPTSILIREWSQSTLNIYMVSTARPGTNSSTGDVAQALYGALQLNQAEPFMARVASSLTA